MDEKDYDCHWCGHVIRPDEQPDWEKRMEQCKDCVRYDDNRDCVRYDDNKEN